MLLFNILLILILWLNYVNCCGLLTVCMLADSIRALLMHSHTASWGAHRPDWLRGATALNAGASPRPRFSERSWSFLYSISQCKLPYNIPETALMGVVVHIKCLWSYTASRSADGCPWVSWYMLRSSCHDVRRREPWRWGCCTLGIMGYISEQPTSSV